MGKLNVVHKERKRKDCAETVYRPINLITGSLMKIVRLLVAD